MFAKHTHKYKIISDMVKPIPDNVKELLSQLPSSQQVVLRSYIATLRSEIVSFEEEKLNADNADPHAHYHGDVKCTADHGHVDTEHIEHHHEHVHTEHAHATKNIHDHHEHEHKHTDHCCEHGHDHKEKHDEHENHEHSDEHDHKEHHHHEHGHGHAEKTDHEHHDDIPAWKKAALSADPTAAPFGGNWQTESNISATEEMKKSAAMEE